jgi:thiosulfate dehydrogenase [quinone] large subunit
MDRQGAGLTLIRLCLGVFFLFEGLGKWRWFFDSSMLASQLTGWHHALPPSSLSAAYLTRFALPGVRLFSRLVPLGEMTVGVALLLGVWTSFFALLAFLLGLNFQFASGALFRYGFLTSGYGLPVLGASLGLAIGARRLPLSLRG